MTGDAPTLCRMHAGSLIADTFASALHYGGRNLAEALRVIDEEGRGVVVYIPPRGNLQVELELYGSSLRPPPDPKASPLRDYGLGAQVLQELGLRKIRLLTNSRRRIAGTHGYDLEIVETIPLHPTAIAPHPPSSGSLP